MFGDPDAARDQLIDILLDWCEHDLDGDSFAGGDAATVAAAMIEHFSYTCASQPEGLALFNDLVASRRASMIYERQQTESEDGSN
ncbi:MAG: hypothetical protein ACW96N_08540 [Candidatus Thorarchaeota archaeon]|jgi:hypothetical protein